MKGSKVFFAKLEKEMNFLMNLQHPHIARLICLSVEKSGGWIMMEHMDMDLQRLIFLRKQVSKKAGWHSTPPRCEEEARELCLKIALGMNFLHSREVIHRDIKAGNVLVHDHGGHFDVKITDLGESHRTGNPNVANSVGTGLYRAPEVLKAKNIKPLTGVQLKKTDVYSYAMTCYEIITGNAPFEGVVIDAQDETFPNLVSPNDVIQGCRPKFPDGLSSDLVNLITKCWDNEPEKRPHFSNICKVLANNPTCRDSNVVALDFCFEKKIASYHRRLN